jgi:cytochrome c peroxidase
MNLAWQDKFMWDGAILNLDMQSLAPISHPSEMAEDISNVVIKLQNSNIYPRLFHNAYGDSIITGEKVLKCLSQFMLTLVSANSKYDQVMLGKDTFTDQEQNGYQLFVKNCASCHKEPLFSTYNFANNGLSIDTNLLDYGRMNITLESKDSLRFKIPTLRNVEFSYPYMHDGRFQTLKEVMNHYTEGIEESKTLDPILKKGIALSSNEKVDIIAFLLTLSDKEFLFNPKFSYPKEIFFPQAKD